MSQTFNNMSIMDLTENQAGQGSPHKLNLNDPDSRLSNHILHDAISRAPSSIMPRDDPASFMSASGLNMTQAIDSRLAGQLSMDVSERRQTIAM